MFSQESVGQWQPDIHDTRTVADRTAIMEINRMLAGMPGTGALLAEYAFGDDAPAEQFRYIDLVRGFALDLPYNENWSTGTYVLPPYELHEEVSEIRFGPLLRHAVNGYERAYIMRYTASRPLDAAEKAYEAQFQADLLAVNPGPVGSGDAVIMESMPGDCPAPVIEVRGTTFNYVFTVSCEAASRWPDALERLKAVAATLSVQ